MTTNYLERSTEIVEEEVEKLRGELLKKRLLTQTRLEGKTPAVIDAIGDMRLMKIATGSVNVGESETVYLTDSITPEGEGVFSGRPWIGVFRDKNATPGGLARADGPAKPEEDLVLLPYSLESNVEVHWNGALRRWSVVVINNTTETANFLVDAIGGI